MQIGIVAKGSAPALMRFGSTSGILSFRDDQERTADSVNTPKLMWRHLLLSAACRAWDSNSARFADS